MARSYRTALRDRLISITYRIGITAVQQALRRAEKLSNTRIICFHRIIDVPAFEQKIATLSRMYNWVSMDQFKRGELSSDAINLCLTFDDGFSSWMDIIPFLERNRVPATFFISSGFLNSLETKSWEEFCRLNLGIQNAEPSISWSEAKLLSQHPLFTIGGHTCNHLSLGRIAQQDDLWREVSVDKQLIEERIGKSLKYFAFPFGDPSSISSLATKIVIRGGYEMAVSLIPGSNCPSDDLFSLRRDCFDEVNDQALLQAWVEGGYDIWKKIQNHISGNKHAEERL